MKVLVVGDFLQTSGMTKYIFNVIGNIQSSQLSFDALSISGSNECEARVNQMGWNMFVIPPANGSLLKHIKLSYSFFKQHAGDYDVIHFNETALWNFLPILFAHRFGSKKIILNSHNTYFASNGSAVTLKILECLHKLGRCMLDRIVWKRIAVSKEAAEWMFSKKAIKQHNYQILTNGIDLKRFEFDFETRQKLDKQLGIQSLTPVYGNVGVLNARKNQIRLLQIFKSILLIEPDACLLLIGDGPMKKEVAQQIATLKLQNRVKMIGAVHNVNDYYQVMDAIIMPSKHEGLSTVLVESQTAGLTVFPSAEIPLGDYIADLVHPISLTENDEKWARVICERMNKTNRRSRLAEMIKKGYDFRTSASSMCDIYLKGDSRWRE